MKPDLLMSTALSTKHEQHGNHSIAYRIACWARRKCPDGHGCPPKLWDIAAPLFGQSGGGGGC